MKKNYTVKNADEQWVMGVLAKVSESGKESFVIQGGLNDMYLIPFDGLRLGRVRRNWLIAIPEYLNTQSNEMHVVLTDDEKIADKFFQEWAKQRDSYNDEDEPEYDENCGDYRYYPNLAGVLFPTLKEEREKEFNRLIKRLSA